MNNIPIFWLCVICNHVFHYILSVHVMFIFLHVSCWYVNFFHKMFTIWILHVLIFEDKMYYCLELSPVSCNKKINFNKKCKMSLLFNHYLKGFILWMYRKIDSHYQCFYPFNRLRASRVAQSPSGVAQLNFNTINRT